MENGPASLAMVGAVRRGVLVVSLDGRVAGTTALCYLFCQTRNARVAQWIRAFASGAKGRRFDPCRGYQIRSQRAEGRDQKGIGTFDHAPEHLADFLTEDRKFSVLVNCDVTTVFCEVQRRVGLTVLTIAIRQLAQEVGFISAFRPRLTQIQTYGT
jgi:hypothetical protein